ncbi:hypothetical protein TcasGA2_TC010135 [Tribolium castaneum]|uniref:Uncharacterized protein n=1 Tax=Tribolium castaneum TaxID=7070 RepID=D6WSQ6_TRICA|nr:hypothetical protein TcasGA2_TC010135 [Tribolium castaneum]
MKISKKLTENRRFVAGFRPGRVVGPTGRQTAGKKTASTSRKGGFCELEEAVQIGVSADFGGKTGVGAIFGEKPTHLRFKPHD